MSPMVYTSSRIISSKWTNILLFVPYIRFILACKINNGRDFFLFSFFVKKDIKARKTILLHRTYLLSFAPQKNKKTTLHIFKF